MSSCSDLFEMDKDEQFHKFVSYKKKEISFRTILQNCVGTVQQDLEPTVVSVRTGGSFFFFLVRYKNVPIHRPDPKWLSCTLITSVQNVLVIDKSPRNKKKKQKSSKEMKKFCLPFDFLVVLSNQISSISISNSSNFLIN